MQVLTVRNVHGALPVGLRYLMVYGKERESRNGPVLVAPEPVTTVFQKPLERVMLHPERDDNPFFHFIESLWMLAGRNDIATLTPYVKRMADFSDDGVTQHGAYGHRWRKHFGFDQLGHIITALKDNPEDRRNVLQMWDATVDLGRDGRDLPCNTQIYFTRTDAGALDMTVCCRSNDIIWGAYGANAVHMSVLQEYVAGGIGCDVGTYYQMSNNYHAYRKTFDPLHALLVLDGKVGESQPYTHPDFKSYPLMRTPVDQWQQDLAMFLDEGMVLGLRDPFFRQVAQPIVSAHTAYRQLEGASRFSTAFEILSQCKAGDWRIACERWIQRRKDNWLNPPAPPTPPAASEEPSTINFNTININTPDAKTFKQTQREIQEQSKAAITRAAGKDK